MSTENESGGVVAYPIKDILEDIKRSIQSIDDKLDAKADVKEVQTIRLELAEVKRTVTELQTNALADSRIRRSSEEWKKWAAPLLVSIAMLVVAILALTHTQGPTTGK